MITTVVLSSLLIFSAGPAPLKYTPVELSTGAKLTFSALTDADPAKAQVTLLDAAGPVAGCNLALEANGVVVPKDPDAGASGCPRLFMARETAQFKLRFVRSAGGQPVDHELTFDAGTGETKVAAKFTAPNKVEVKGLPAGATALVFFSESSGAWDSISQGGEILENDTPLPFPGFLLAVQTADGTIHRFRVATTQTEIAGLSAAPERDAERRERLAREAQKRLQEEAEALNELFLGCSPPPGFADHYVICADAFAGTKDAKAPEVTGLPRNGHVIRPNRSILVMVRRPAGYGISVSLSGERGLVVPRIRDEVSRDKAERGDLDQAESVVSLHSFAPRKAGNADLKIRVFRTGQTAEADETTVELIVDETYAGALRLGLGVIRGSAVDRTFEAKTLPGSSQGEIITTTSGDTDLELVLGFAPYLEYYKGGRSYAGSDFLTSFPFGFSPYVGVGILNEEKGTLQTLKSIHLGLEWEPQPNFSIALNFVFRRVTRLADHLALGGPAPDGPLPTTTGYELGGAIVFNVSPEFFKLAAKQGSSFFQ